MSIIYVGDSLNVLRTIESNSVQTCVTSPPYWGLRDYGVDGQLGLEETPEEFTENLVKVFNEVKRVLKDDGTLWLNLGDSYNSSSSNRTGTNGYNDGRNNRSKRFSAGGCEDLKPKDLVGIPWRVAFALQSDGWFLRQDIIWAKPNPMPESVTDRCTKSHEYIFLLSKSQRYYFDNKAIAEDAVSEKPAGNKNHKYVGTGDVRNRSKEGLLSLSGIVSETRNKRSVWAVSTKPFSEAHFATFPAALIEPCILAGSKEGDTVLDPFSGAGTTGLVSLAKNRKYIGIELNPEYAEMSLKRINNDAPMFNAIESREIK